MSKECPNSINVQTTQLRPLLSQYSLAQIQEKKTTTRKTTEVCSKETIKTPERHR